MAALVVVACSNEGIAFKKAEQSYAIGEYYTASIHYKKSYSRCTPKEKDCITEAAIGTTINIQNDLRTRRLRSLP